MEETYYKIRRPISGGKYGAEITLPPPWSNKYAPPGELVRVLYNLNNGVLWIIPKGVEVDLQQLRAAIKTKT